MAETKQFRDVFNPTVVIAFAERLKKAQKAFDDTAFTNYINPKLAELSYSERINLIVDGLEKYLPKDYAKAVDVLLASQLPPYKTEEFDELEGRFMTVPQTYFVAKKGLEHFELSMHALYEMTKRFTSEFGVRAFILHDADKAFSFFKKWTKDPDPHVRRLVSEGSRPILPWGKKLNIVEENPQLTLGLLTALKDDPSEYVRRSVANHLNDLAKKNGDFVVETLSSWRKTSSGKEFDRMSKHALRTLIKNGHSGALAFMGYRSDVKVELVNLKCSPNINLGEKLNFSFSLLSKNEKNEKLVVDYVIHFIKANGTTSPKVFKLKNTNIQPNKCLEIEKKHPIKPITTRVYYEGEHRLEIQVNGKIIGGTEFNLKF